MGASVSPPVITGSLGRYWLMIYVFSECRKARCCLELQLAILLKKTRGLLVIRKLENMEHDRVFSDKGFKPLPGDRAVRQARLPAESLKPGPVVPHDPTFFRTRPQVTPRVLKQRDEPVVNNTG